MSLHYHSSFYKIFLLIIVSAFGFQFTHTFASGSMSIVRGDSVIINWNVVGGSGTCTADTPYPVTGPIDDGIRAYWQGLKPSAGASPTFAAYAAPGAYTFVCTDPTPPGKDTTTLIIKDCNPGDMWNGSNACVPAGPPVIGVSFKATPNPVAFNTPTTLSWLVTGPVASCTLSGGQFGAGIPVAATDNRTTNNLMVATT